MEVKRKDIVWGGKSKRKKKKTRCRAPSPLFIIANNVVLWIDVS